MKSPNFSWCNIHENSTAQIAQVHPVPLPGCPDRRDAAATHGRGELGQARGQGGMGWIDGRSAVSVLFFGQHKLPQLLSKSLDFTHLHF
jgi:hypothetical protein